MTCTRCGSQMAPGGHLCASCGAAALPAGPVVHGGRHIAIAVAALVVAAAITGTAVAFARSGPQPAGRRAMAGQPRTPGSLASMPEAGEVPAPVSPAPVSPASSPAASPSGPLVGVDPAAAAGPHEGAVLAFVTRYFTAINHHRFRAYLRLFSRESRSGLSAGKFRGGYGTTTDVTPKLVKLESDGSRRLAATLTFTSHQRADTSPLRAACVHWTITLYLVRDGRQYVIGNPPADYAATGRAC